MGNESLERSADEALRFVREKMMDGSKLSAVYRRGTAYLKGYLNDYAFMLQAALDSLESSRAPDFARDMALSLAEELVSSFADDKRGGFYFTAHDHEKLILRHRTATDEVMPSGNSVAARALHRMRGMDGGERFAKAAHECLRSFSPLVRSAPLAMAGLLSASLEHIDAGAQRQ